LNTVNEDDEVKLTETPYQRSTGKISLVKFITQVFFVLKTDCDVKTRSLC